MNLLYNGAVGYERFKNFWGAIISLFIGIILLIIGTIVFFNPPQPTPSNNIPINKSNTPSNTPSNTLSNTPAEPAPSPYGWVILSVFGILLIIFSGIMYFLATDNSDTTKNILAAQGAYDAYSTIFGNRKNGGYFIVGE